MGAPRVVACLLAVFLPAICQGQQYWGGYGWRPVRHPLVNEECERAYPVDEATAMVLHVNCHGGSKEFASEVVANDSTWCLRYLQCHKMKRTMFKRVQTLRLDCCVEIRQRRLKFPAVVRSCQFVCKQRRNAFLANEDNGTPCLAWGGQVGYCDQGVCKALEATAAPTTAQATSTVVSTPTELPGASSSAESTTVATTPAPVPAVPVVRPPWRPGFVGVKCDRAYPARVGNGRVAKCRFLCGGYPTLGIGFEEDGTPCWGVTAEGAESTTVPIRNWLLLNSRRGFLKSRPQPQVLRQAKINKRILKENVSEAAKSATTVESRPTDNTGNVVEVTAALEQTTVESVPESTVVQTKGADLDGSGQKKTPSADEVTASNEVEGDEAQGSSATDAVTGEGEEEGSGNTDEQTDSSVSSQEVTTSSSGVEEVVAVVSETECCHCSCIYSASS
ncbi:hypothetical protein MRX96_047719 [Rhipicephalus microplus]